MLPRWRWSISKALGRVTAERFDVGVAGAGIQFDREARVLASGGGLVATELGNRHPGRKAESKAVNGMEVGGEGDGRTLVAHPFRAN